MSNTVKYIFGQPEFVENVGEIHPIQMKYYDEFMNTANILCLSYDHFNVEEIKKIYNVDEIKLLDLIVLYASQYEQAEKTFLDLNKIFSYILRKEVYFNFEDGIFEIRDETKDPIEKDKIENEEDNIESVFSINRNNYDEVREIIMRQNLLFTPKVYKNKTIQEWAERVLKARAKNGLDSSIEDMISTIAVISSKDYDKLANYTIYQIRQEFNRIMKIESYRTGIAYRCAGDDKTKIDHYAETMDMFKNPYDDIFKEKSAFKNINAAIKGS